jgi:hypothetical protein
MDLLSLFDQLLPLDDCQARGLLSSHGSSRDETILALLFGVATKKIPVSLLNDLAPDLTAENWEKLYGEHWGTYGLVADFVKSSGAEPAVVRSKILMRKNEFGSFYGDIILTSLISCALLRGLDHPTAWGDAEDALCWLANKEQKLRTPPFDSLTIWDTAWAISTLKQLGLAYEHLAESISWLQRLVIKRSYGAGWSWSTESNLLCIDSTSLICECFINEDFSDSTLKKSISSAFASLTQLHLIDGMWPTFVSEHSKTEPCPIITARMLSLRMGKGQASQNDWAVLLRKVITGTRSPWFTDGAITEGIVLYYAAGAVGPALPECRQLFKDLLKRTREKSITLEGRLSTLMGCTAFARKATFSLQRTRSFVNVIREVIDACTSEQAQDGSWSPYQVGRFGFEMNYGDRVFTTCLGITALNNCRQLTIT